MNNSNILDISNAPEVSHSVGKVYSPIFFRRYIKFSTVKPTNLVIGIAVLWISLIILLPLAALAVTAAHRGVIAFFRVLFSVASLQALTLTFTVSAIVTVINAFFGVIIAWLLEREKWPAKAAINICIDIPFALPTIVVSLVLLSLYGKDSHLGFSAMGTPLGLIIALTFVTFPFVIRQVQPVLKELEVEVEEAAASLGAKNSTILRRIILPALWPAIITGAGLCFTRAIGEYGSLILIGGDIPGKTQVASQYIAQLLEIDDSYSASVISLGLIIPAFLALNGLQWIVTHRTQRGRRSVLLKNIRQGNFRKAKSLYVSKEHI